MTTDLALKVVDKSTDPPSVDTSRLSWATSIFYFGMLAGLYPMTFVFQRFSTRYVLGPVVLLWAIVCAATAGVTSWRGLFVQRFFLGTPTGTQECIATLSNQDQDSSKALSQLGL